LHFFASIPLLEKYGELIPLLAGGVVRRG